MMTTHTAAEFDSALEKYLTRCLAISSAHYNADCPAGYKWLVDLIKIPGKKYVKIAIRNGLVRANTQEFLPNTSQGSAHSFVALDTGNVYYPASWKIPSTKYVRGNIFDEKNGTGWVGPYGVKTMR